MFCHGRSCATVRRGCQAIKRDDERRSNGGTAATPRRSGLPARGACTSFGDGPRRTCVSGSARRCARLRRRPRTCGYFWIRSLEGAARRRPVAELELARRDVEQRVGHLLAVRKGGDQLALRGNGRAVVLLRELRIADPVLRRRRERALWIRLDEGAEASDRRRVVGGPELIVCGVVTTLLVRDVGQTGDRATGDRAADRRRCDRRSGRQRPGGRRPGWRGRGTGGRGHTGNRRRRRAGAARRGAAFELAQPRVEIDVEIARALLRLLLLVGQNLDLAAQPRDVGPDLLDLSEQFDEALAFQLHFERARSGLQAASGPARGAGSSGRCACGPRRRRRSRRARAARRATRRAARRRSCAEKARDRLHRGLRDGSVSS